MRIFSRKNAPVIAGCLYGAAFVLLLDGILVAQKEELAENRFSVLLSIPALFSTLGWFLLVIISPQEIRQDNVRAKIALFVAWLTLFSAAVSANCIAYFFFQGKQTRSRSFPGVALVLFTSLAPLTGSMLWWSRDQFEDDDF